MSDDLRDGFDDDFSYWRKVVDTLYEGGMTDDPEVFMACNWFVETNGDHEMLEDLLNERPDILAMARRNMMVDVKAKKANPFHPEPSGDEVNELKGEIVLGEVNGIGDTVGLDPIAFTRGLFICGEIGSGKSYPVLRMLNQILSVPISERGYNVIVVQAVKRDADFLVRDYEDLKVLEWEDIRRAPLSVESWDNWKNKISSFCGVYSAVNWLQLHGQPLLKRDVELCFEKYGTGEVTFGRLFGEVDNASKAIGLLGMEHRNVRDNLKFSLFSFKESGQVLNCTKGFSVSEFFTKNDLILNVMDQSSDYIIGTFLGDLFKDIQRYYEANPLDSGLRTLIVIDECRRVFPSADVHSRSGHNPNQPMENFVTTRRSSGIGLIAVTQEPQSAPQWLTNNSAYVLAMPISGEGRDHVKKLLNLSDEEASHIDKLGSLGIGIMRYRGFDRRFIVDVPDDLVIEPTSKEVVQEMMQGYIDELHLSLSTGVEEEEVKFFDAKGEKKKAIDRLNSLYVIERLVSNPFQTFTELRSVLKLSASRMRDCIDLLIADELAKEIECMGIRGRKAKYIALTERVENRAIGAAHFKHRLYQDHIVEWLTSRDLEGEVEYSREGCWGNIDVYVSFNDGKVDREMAYEVTLTLNKEEVIGNIDKCLSSGNFNVQELCIVCEDEESSDSVVKMVGDSEISGSDLERITFMKIRDFALL